MLLATDVDSRFFNSLYQSYWSELCARLRKQFGNGPPDPEDVAQQSFIKFSQVANSQPIANPRGYIYTLAKNLYVDMYRQQSSHEKLIDNLFAELELEPIESISAETIAQEQQLLDNLSQIIEQLNEKQQRILKASRIDGLTYQQISATTGYSVADISRNMKKIMDILSRHQQQVNADEQLDDLSTGTAQ